MLDSDLAEFYGVRTDRLTQAIGRNQDRFPDDFCFRLTREEFAGLTPQNAGSNTGRGGRRHLPLVFTEQGALAVSAVLRGERATAVSIAVARAFVAMRQMLEDMQALVDRLDAMETENDELRREVEELKALTTEHQADIDAMIDSHAQLSEIVGEFERTDPDGAG